MIDRYFSRAGVEPHEGSVKGIVPVSSKSYSMRTIRKRIADGRIHGLNSFDAYHFVEREYKPSHDFFISYETTYGDETCQFVNAVSPEAERYNLALDFLRDMLAFVTPCYGYSLEMPLGHDPALFAIGAFAYSDEIQDEIHVWQQSVSCHVKGSAHKQGRMRHVFAINVLSRPHMEARIDGNPLVSGCAAPTGAP